MKIGECKGIITLRDVRVAIVRFGHDSLKKKVEDVMTKKLITIDSGSTIADAERIMAKKAIHHLPVVDERGEIKGLISARDLRYSFGAFLVEDIMTEKIITAPPTFTLVEAVKIMHERDISSLLVK